ncbi:MAG: hypothetical protein JRE71_13515 [Deltaproteobacteria bacterium]|nr:hypothetical protein [Deltaproteobacteria bacterium]
MTWEEIGALGELTGALAAVVLLGYIAYQIRQNSRMLEQNAQSTRAVILQGGTEFYVRFSELLARDSTLAGIWRRVRAGETIDEVETIRFESALNILVAYVEHAYLQAELGTYSVDVLSVGGSLLSEILSLRPARLWWERDGYRSFRPEFVANLNRLLKTSTDTPNWPSSDKRP